MKLKKSNDGFFCYYSKNSIEKMHKTIIFNKINYPDYPRETIILLEHGYILKYKKQYLKNTHRLTSYVLMSKICVEIAVVAQSGRGTCFRNKQLQVQLLSAALMNIEKILMVMLSIIFVSVNAFWGGYATYCEQYIPGIVSIGVCIFYIFSCRNHEEYFRKKEEPDQIKYKNCGQLNHYKNE